MQITVVPHRYANVTILNKMVEIWKLFSFYCQFALRSTRTIILHISGVYLLVSPVAHMIHINNMPVQTLTHSGKGGGEVRQAQLLQTAWAFLLSQKQPLDRRREVWEFFIGGLRTCWKFRIYIHECLKK